MPLLFLKAHFPSSVYLSSFPTPPHVSLALSAYSDSRPRDPYRTASSSNRAYRKISHTSCISPLPSCLPCIPPAPLSWFPENVDYVFSPSCTSFINHTTFYSNSARKSVQFLGCSPSYIEKNIDEAKKSLT